MNTRQTTSFEIDNLKCGGCANTISKALHSFTGLTDGHVDFENGTVSFAHDADFDLQGVKSKLASLGYPEAGSASGLEKMVGVAKSYVSCAVGNMSK